MHTHGPRPLRCRCRAGRACTEQTLSSWQTSPHLLEWQVGNAVLEALLSAGSPRLEDLTDTLVRQLVADYDKVDGLHSRRRGLIKRSRVLANKGIPAPLHNNESKTGPRSDMLSTVPPEWAEWALRWRKFSTHEPGTIRSMFSVILIAGRWAAEKHPDVISPDQWTRDMAAEYIAAVKDGIDQMLEQLDLTDDEREALEGDREAVTALAERLADTPTPAGTTPRDLGTTGAFVPLTQLMSTVPAQKLGRHDKQDIDRKPPGYQE